MELPTISPLGGTFPPSLLAPRKAELEIQSDVTFHPIHSVAHQIEDSQIHKTPALRPCPPRQPVPTQVLGGGLQPRHSVEEIDV